MAPESENVKRDSEIFEVFRKFGLETEEARRKARFEELDFEYDYLKSIVPSSKIRLSRTSHGHEDRPSDAELEGHP